MKCTKNFRITILLLAQIVKKKTISITVSYKENADKKDFENWVQKLDDDIFTETWENLSEKYGLDKLNKIYQTPEYNKVIKLFKEQATQLAKNKIMTLSNLFGLN